MATKIKVIGKTQNGAALGVAKAYVKMNPATTLADLRKAFPNDIAPDKGVAELFLPLTEAEAFNAKADMSLYFTKDERPIKLQDGSIIAMSQIWTNKSLDNLIKAASKYSIDVEVNKGAKADLGNLGFKFLYIEVAEPVTYRKSTTDADSKERGKAFISNLKNTIDKVVIYKDGQNGERCIDSYETRKEKMEQLLLAEPETPYEIFEYVYFCQSMNGAANKNVMTKLHSVLEKAKYEYHANETYKAASSIVKGMQRKKTTKLVMKLLWRSILCILCTLGYIWGFTTEWGTFGKIVWGIGIGVLIFDLWMFLVGMLLMDNNDESLF